MTEPMCRCGHPANVHARVDRRDGGYAYPCRQVLPLDPFDGRLRAEPAQCPCADIEGKL